MQINDIDSILSQSIFHVMSQINLRRNKKVLEIGAKRLKIASLMLPFLNTEGYSCTYDPSENFEETLIEFFGDQMMSNRSPLLVKNKTFGPLDLKGNYDFIFVNDLMKYFNQKKLNRLLNDCRRMMSNIGVIIGQLRIDEKLTEEDEIKSENGYSMQHIGELVRNMNMRVIFTEWKTPHKYKVQLFCTDQNFNDLITFVSKRGKIWDLY